MHNIKDGDMKTESRGCGDKCGCLTKSKCQCHIDIAGKDYTKSDMECYSFIGSNLTKSNFDDALVSSADFTKANISDATFKNSELLMALFNETTANETDFSNGVSK